MLTFDEAHRQMWDYVATRFLAIAEGREALPDADVCMEELVISLKEAWPGMTQFDSVLNSCFACMYAANRASTRGGCSDACPDNCFLDWRSPGNPGSRFCTDAGSPYYELTTLSAVDRESCKIASVLAARIRDMPKKSWYIPTNIQEG